MNYNSNKANEGKQEHNETIVAICTIIFAIVMAFIAINNFGLFIIICIVGTIIFSIANAIVVSIKKRNNQD